MLKHAHEYSHTRAFSDRICNENAQLKAQIQKKFRWITKTKAKAHPIYMIPIRWIVGSPKLQKEALARTISYLHMDVRNTVAQFVKL